MLLRFLNSPEVEEKPSEASRKAFKPAVHNVEVTVGPLLKGWLQYARDGMFPGVVRLINGSS